MFVMKIISGSAVCDQNAKPFNAQISDTGKLPVCCKRLITVTIEGEKE
jgi:hypothetical protein